MTASNWELPRSMTIKQAEQMIKLYWTGEMPNMRITLPLIKKLGYTMLFHAQSTVNNWRDIRTELTNKGVTLSQAQEAEVRIFQGWLSIVRLTPIQLHLSSSWRWEQHPDGWKGWKKPSRFWYRLIQPDKPPEDLTDRWPITMLSITWAERWRLLWQKGSSNRGGGGVLTTILAAAFQAVWSDRNKRHFRNQRSKTPLEVVLKQSREEIEASFNPKDSKTRWELKLGALSEINRLISSAHSHRIRSRNHHAEETYISLTLASTDGGSTHSTWGDPSDERTETSGTIGNLISALTIADTVRLTDHPSSKDAREQVIILEFQGARVNTDFGESSALVVGLVLSTKVQESSRLTVYIKRNMSLDELEHRSATVFRQTGAQTVWSDAEVEHIAGPMLWKRAAKEWRISEVEPRLRLLDSGAVKNPSAEVWDFMYRVEQYKSLISCQAGTYSPAREITADSLVPVVKRALALNSPARQERTVRLVRSCS
ncbi:hypothetical protein R1sor_004309 [Riccia sorocarpa]|uniref:Uncharacterized protein n=1 Tax=Riccia sorocarpa TaxID=122646 RepID=A0ABD3HGZ6_9MARC